MPMIFHEGESVCRSAQSKVIDDLIRYYQTGESRDWIQFDIDWVQNDEPVDFANGFIEIYRDARGAKGKLRVSFQLPIRSSRPPS